jgi:hypothetical protein
MMVRKTRLLTTTSIGSEALHILTFTESLYQEWWMLRCVRVTQLVFIVTASLDQERWHCRSVGWRQ